MEINNFVRIEKVRINKLMILSEKAGQYIIE